MYAFNFHLILLEYFNFLPFFFHLPPELNLVAYSGYTAIQQSNCEFEILSNFETISSFPFRTIFNYFFIIFPNYLYFLFILSAFVESSRELRLYRCHVHRIFTSTSSYQIMFWIKSHHTACFSGWHYCHVPMGSILSSQH